MLTQFDGQKEILLIDPFESHKLYADFPVSERNARVLDHSRFGFSPIESLSVDLCTFPAAAEATVYNLTLSPGDALYIPPVWWHLVTSLPREATGRTIATTLQGIFLAKDWPGGVASAAWLQVSIARRKGCPMGEYRHAPPPSDIDTEVCNASANQRAKYPLAWPYGRAASRGSWWPDTHVGSPPRWSCVRRPPWDGLLRAASHGVVSFARSAFEALPRGAVGASPCFTWAGNASYSVAMGFDTSTQPGDEAALVLGLEEGAALYAGLAERAPSADIWLRCPRFAPVASLVHRPYEDMHRDPDEAFRLLAAAAASSFASCILTARAGAQLPPELDCALSAQPSAECTVAHGMHFVERLQRMLYAYWGRVDLVTHSAVEVLHAPVRTPPEP